MIDDPNNEAPLTYGDNQMEKTTMSGIHRMRNPPVRKIIETQIAEFKKMIEIREQLLTKLDENKGVEETLDLLRKIGI